jgi:hypothetical protein
MATEPATAQPESDHTDPARRHNLLRDLRDHLDAAATAAAPTA